VDWGLAHAFTTHKSGFRLLRAGGVQRSFVGNPWLRQGIRCLRMTAEILEENQGYYVREISLTKAPIHPILVLQIGIPEGR
jgi:hypothetical protein